MKSLKLSKRFQRVLLYGIVLATLVFFLKWLQWNFLIIDNAIDIYIGILAILFLTLGAWVANQLIKPKTIIVEREVSISDSKTFSINENAIKRLGISRREYEVLQLLAGGHSNADMASELFVSLSTVKTHVSNLFQKLDVKSRTQAIGKAKELKIIP
ncbi:helix-turn-helix transcriptional regulator [Parapedobacter pyrenivorans]|uniref:Helix-turn-helix transcriptional regulator n=1 Tax=Parapedobacter pyrenivorans TaxID=1305674 RepID=A0A917MC21_9SPHI|nr:response regulator transcription factor [Parapedobacter pyrenivorans]GGG90481.1 helix-turn-helix transcriptional regulator [Parapedobacter pyrenivorans]